MAYSSRTEQLVDHVAVLIYSRLADGASKEDIERMNEEQGWCFHVRWFDGTYKNSSQYDEMTGLKLTQTNLQAAYLQAESLRKSLSNNKTRCAY